MPATVIRMFVFTWDLGNCAAAQNTEVRKEKIRFIGKMTGVEQGSKLLEGRYVQMSPFLIVK